MCIYGTFMTLCVMMGLRTLVNILTLFVGGGGGGFVEKVEKMISRVIFQGLTFSQTTI